MLPFAKLISPLSWAKCTGLPAQTGVVSSGQSIQVAKLLDTQKRTWNSFHLVNVLRLATGLDKFCWKKCNKIPEIYHPGIYHFHFLGAFSLQILWKATGVCSGVTTSQITSLLIAVPVSKENNWLGGLTHRETAYRNHARESYRNSCGFTLITFTLRFGFIPFLGP